LIAFGCSNGKSGIFSIKYKKVDALYQDHLEGPPIVAVCFNNSDSLIASAANRTIIVRSLSDPNSVKTFQEKSVSL